MPRPDDTHYKVVSPLATHWREATCEEVDCIHYLHGWTIQVKTALSPAEVVVGAGDLAAEIRRSGKQYREERVGETSIFIFEAGQECFRPHVTPIGRDPLFMRESMGQRQMMEPEEFNHNWNEEHEGIKRIQERG